MNFLYPFMNFFQPGVFWPQLTDLKPMLVLSVLALIVGVSKTAVYPRHEAFTHPIFKWVTIFILIQALSLIPSGFSEMFSALSYWIIYLIFVVASILLISDEQALRRYVWGMMAGSIFIVIFGIVAVTESWSQAVGGRAGAYGMYENHNDYSFIIIQTLPFLYMYRKVTENRFFRFLLGLSIIACVIGTFLSLSRGGILALVLEFGLIILIGMEGRKRFAWIPVLIIVGAAAIGYQWITRAENQGDNYTAADAENSRFELWRAGAAMVLDRPLLGVGSGHFFEYARKYGEISHDNRGKNTHNTYLEILTGTGFLGFTAFVCMIAALIKNLRRAALPRGSPLVEATRRATLIAIYSILFRATLDAKPHDWSFYILCAIGLSCIILQRRHIDSSVAQANPGVSPNGLPI